MNSSKYNTFLTVLLIIIIVAIVGIIGFLGYKFISSENSKKEAENFVDSWNEDTNQGNKKDEGTISTDTKIDVDVTTPEQTESTKTDSTQTKENTYYGFLMAGTIEIPKTNVKCPVLEGPASNDKIEVAVAVQYPLNATLNTEGNVVIAGHNYRNGTFFSDNKKLGNGDKIYITDLNGSKVEYRVYNTFITEANDNSIYNRDTDGKREITLYSCTDDLAGRLIVQARAD